MTTLLFTLSGLFLGLAAGIALGLRIARRQVERIHPLFGREWREPKI